MRVFIALKFSEEVKEKLDRIQQSVKALSAKGNFTRRENLHLTLRFIGEVKPEELSGLSKAIDKAALNNRSFKLVFDRLGEFPQGRKRIIWLGGPLSEELRDLVEDVEGALEGQGYPREGKAFVPHITLGREVILKGDFRFLQKSLSFDPVEVKVDKITLMESTRIEGKLKYLKLYESQLKKVICKNINKPR